MSERKVLNKYYPPDFDPDVVPREKLNKYRQFHIRTMAPFNMRCKMCGEFIYKGKKFNSRKETVRNEFYLGLEIYRFYIKCPRCLAEITYKTDPENTDYTIEHGAIRNFEADITAKKMLEEKAQELEDELIQNPMKILENRTKDSQREMEILENLEEIKELNARYVNIDFDALLTKHAQAGTKAKLDRQTLEKLDEDLAVQKIMAEKISKRVKRLPDDEDEETDEIISKIGDFTNTTTEKTQSNPNPLNDESIQTSKSDNNNNKNDNNSQNKSLTSKTTILSQSITLPSRTNLSKFVTIKKTASVSTPKPANENKNDSLNPKNDISITNSNVNSLVSYASDVSNNSSSSDDDENKKFI